MFQLSAEQQKIGNAIREGKNVQVDAVAGAGKTTSILAIAQECKEKHFIQITYNSSLKNEVKQKVVNWNIDNVAIFTYHSAGYKYYTKECSTDLGLYRILDEQLPIRREEGNEGGPVLPHIIHVVVIDEAQDMTDLYYHFLVYFLKDVLKSNQQHQFAEDIQLLVLGDKYQGLYEFKNADVRYLTLAYRIWSSISSRPFEFISLSHSYRITEETAQFVNQIMLGETRLIARKNGPKVVYYKDQPFHGTVCSQIVNKIIDLITLDRISPDEIFILAPSFKSSKTLVNRIEHQLVKNHIPCFVPISENSLVSDTVIKNKIAFTTFHQSKGRERKIVFVLCFDDSYFQFYAPTLPTTICPASLYVATTRATEQLIVVDTGEYMLPFLKIDSYSQLKKLSFVEHNNTRYSIGKPSIQIAKESPPDHRTSPTELIKFMDCKTLHEISQIMERHHLFSALHEGEEEGEGEGEGGKEKKIELSPCILNSYYGTQLHEEVCDINGLAIPALFEVHVRQNCVIYEEFVRNATKNKLLSVESSQQIRAEIILEALSDPTSSIPSSSSSSSSSPAEGTGTGTGTGTRRVPKECIDCYLSIPDHLLVTNYYMAMKRGYRSRIAQIVDYSWLTRDMEYFLDIVKKNVPVTGTMTFEKTILNYEEEDEMYDQIDLFTARYFPPGFILRIRATVDLDDGIHLWEFKCVTELTIEHQLQLIIYAWIWKMSQQHYYGPRQYKLFNISTGKGMVLHYHEKQINEIMKLVLKNKYSRHVIKNDEEFISSCNL